MRPQHILDHVRRSSDDQLARDLLHGEVVFQLGRSARRDGDTRSFASARRFLKEILARHDRVFRDTLVSTMAADKAKGGDLHRHRAAAALDCARVLPSLPWLDLRPVEPRGRA
jgi:hypothetical protein